MAMRLSFGVALSAGMLLATAGIAGAGVAGSPATSHNLIPKFNKGPGWQITTDTAPAHIDYDEGSSPWSMALVGKRGNALGKIAEGKKTYFFEQVISPDGVEDWDGWQAKILTPGWEWVVGHPKRPDPSFSRTTESGDTTASVGIPGLTRSVTAPNGSAGGSLDFDFDAFSAGGASGEMFVLRGYLRFVGLSPTIKKEKFTGGQITVESQPDVPSQIPAPGTAALMAMVGATALRRRRSTGVISRSGENGLD